MTVSVHSLRESRAARVAELTPILAKGAAGSLDDAGAARIAALEGELAKLDAQIRNAERLAELERRAPADPVFGDIGRELRSYSLAAAITGALTGRLTGVEAEFHQEATRGREARTGAGFHLAVPVGLLLGNPETRDGQTAGTPAAGGMLVPNTIASPLDRFRPALKTEGMGATVLRGLTGNLELPALDSSGSAAWVAENGNATRSAAAFGKVAMAPKTVAGEYRVSRRLMLQSGTAVDSILKSDLGLILAQAVDFAAIAGTGTGNMPRGILATSGVETVATETLLSDTAAEMIGALDLDDITGTTGFLTNPTVAKLARKIKDGDGLPITEATIFHGKRVDYTTQVPNNIGAGSNKSALIYGVWSELVIGYWSSVDLLVNPYHPDVASNGGILIHAFLDTDVVVRRPKAFVTAEI